MLGPAFRACARLNPLLTKLVTKGTSSSLRLQQAQRVSYFFHSKPQRFTQRDMRVRLIPALSDNYMYLLIDEKTRVCAAVDPVEPHKVIAAVKEEGVTLQSVLTTHHHYDHAGGNKELSQMVSGLMFYGGDDRIDALTNKVTQGDKFKVGDLHVQCFFTPCHTTGHICYFVTGETGEAPLVFTGDTLFVGGCGRFFEGNPAQMYHNLVEVLGTLPPETRVYCGHEYTVNNLKYALHVEPANDHIKSKLQWAQAQRSQNIPTIPSTIEEEHLFNVFMRVGESSIQRHTGATAPVDVMAALRKEKDGFKASV